MPHKKIVILISCLLLSLFSRASHSAPSFDCSKARTRTEKLICLPSNTQLQQLDRELMSVYKKAQKTKYKVYIKKAQQKWLAYRDKYCDNENAAPAQACLTQIYRTRINELEQGLISYPVMKSEMPHALKAGKVLSGKIEFTEKVKSRSPEGEILEYQVVLFNKMSKYVLWTGQGYRAKGPGQDVAELIAVKIHHYRDKDLLFEIITHEYGGHATSSSIYDQTVHSFSVRSNRTGRIFYQGLYTEGGSGGSYSSVEANWFTDRHMLELWLTATQKTVGDYSYIQRLDRKIHTIRFTNTPWYSRKAGAIHDLQGNMRPTRYLALYEKIDKKIEYPKVMTRLYKPISSCMEYNIDWVKVAEGIDYWLSFAIKAQQEGISYAQAFYALPQLTHYQDQYKLSDSTIEFARALDLYRRNVQRGDDWEAKMKNATHDPDNITPETLKANGVTVLENRCAEKLILPKYDYLKIDKWLNTFWARRFKDNSDGLAEAVIDRVLAHR